jgi:hypothetical protein
MELSMSGRSVEVQPEDLAGFAQCHFFAGIGLWPSACAAPAGQMTDLFGLDLAPAGPSVRRPPKKASTTRATFGRNGFGSSASAGLTCSLVSNLMRRTRGSILFG